MCHFDMLQLYCISVPGVLTWVVAFLDKQLISFWTENEVIFYFLIYLNITVKPLKELCHEIQPNLEITKCPLN